MPVTQHFTKYDEGAKRDVTNKIESFLQNELQQHTCPVCFEPMLPPNKSPMLLFPCGHTFCDECIKKQKTVPFPETTVHFPQMAVHFQKKVSVNLSFENTLIF